MAGEQENDNEFKVRDKRRFYQSDKGDIIEQPQDDSTNKKSDERKAEPEQGSFPPIDFATFILSLSSSALMHLGVVPDPFTKEFKQELPLAKQTIDMISMIKDKTKGNLTKDEEQVIDNILYDLRMRYVEQVRKSQKS